LQLEEETIAIDGRLRGSSPRLSSYERANTVFSSRISLRNEIVSISTRSVPRGDDATVRVTLVARYRSFKVVKCKYARRCMRVDSP